MSEVTPRPERPTGAPVRDARSGAARSGSAPSRSASSRSAPSRSAPSPSDQTTTVAIERVAGPDQGDQAEGDRGRDAGDGPGIELTVPWHRHGTGPIPTADGPVSHRWRKVAGRTMSKAWGDSLFGLSSQAAFWCALSTAPLLLALLGLVGFIAPLFGDQTLTIIREQIDVFLRGIFNTEVAENLVGNTVRTILDQQRSDVVSVGLLISLWAGSSAMSAFVESITVAYGQHEVRHPVAERFFALALYLVFLIVGIFGLPLLAIGPDLLARAFPKNWEDNAATIINIVYYPALGVGILLLLATLYKVAPKHRHAWKRGVPGAVLAALVFFVASFGLRLYLTYVYSHGLTYGALATPITFLLFYYFISMAIIIGAQFNNALLEYYPPRRSRRELRKWRRFDPDADPGGAARTATG